MKVDMLVTTRDGQLVAGTIELRNGSLEVTADKNYVQLMTELMGEPLRIDGMVISPLQEPVRWLSALPSYYTGSYLRAKLYS